MCVENMILNIENFRKIRLKKITVFLVFLKKLLRKYR